MSRQTVLTQIRLLLEEQSDLGLHCLLLHLRILSLSELFNMLNESCCTVQGKLKSKAKVAFVFKLPVGQVEFSGLFLTLVQRDFIVYSVSVARWTTRTNLQKPRPSENDYEGRPIMLENGKYTVYRQVS